MILAVAALAAGSAAWGAIAIDLSDPSLPCVERDISLPSPLHLVHVVEDVDIGRPRSTWTIPLFDSAIAPYDRDALLWRHPVTAHLGYLSQPRETGVFMRVPGTAWDVRRLAGDVYELRQGPLLFRYADRLLMAAAFEGGSWQRENDPDGVTGWWVTPTGTRQLQFTRDAFGRLTETRTDTVTAVLEYDAQGQLRSVRAKNAVWTFTYRDGRLEALALNGVLRSCRWAEAGSAVRASSFSDLSQVKAPVVTLQPHVDAH